MKSYKKYFFCFSQFIGIPLLVITIGFGAQAQDIHFSQWQNNPILTSPSYAGFFDGYLRLSGAYRSQWGSVTTPYQTIFVSGDFHLMQRNYNRDMMGIGISLFDDVAGDSKFGTLEGSIALSYIKSFNNQNNHFAGIGLSLGVGQRSISYDELHFDNQWDGNSFNPSLSNQETFYKNRFTFFDLSLGVHWFWQMNNKTGIEAGASGWHINHPEMTIFNDMSIILNTKYDVFAKLPLELNDKLTFIPEFMFMTREYILIWCLAPNLNTIPISRRPNILLLLLVYIIELLMLFY